MKSILLPLHLVFAGLWLGCVLTEALFERALLGTGRDKELILAKLHKKVDIFIEIPAFLLVLITGGFMLHSAPHSMALLAKIGFGGLALVANVYCVCLVFKRVRYASDGHWKAFEIADHLQHKIGALVLIGILGAFGLGLYLYALS
ncbi:MAG: hypothetical protein HYS18_02315 [Burkholderiales bacterium]|nr:hypothetical protein [Burkholderiales bacterium]